MRIRPAGAGRPETPGVILAIDQGTTGTACLVVDEELRPRGRGYREVPQHFPRPGWVEHDPEDLWQSVLGAAEDALAAAGLRAADLEAIGITNQRETTVVWDRRTGRPVHRAIVWQDRRTAERCKELPRDLVRDRTGLVPDPYFSATKLEWLLSERDASGLAFGTVDSWLVWKLTGGRAHVTDVSNASRTLLFNLETLAWDPDLLELFGVPPDVLPEVVPSSGLVADAELFGARVPIAGIAGDQQAALFGQACFSAGEAKATYGTGSFVPALTGLGSPYWAPEARGILTGLSRGTRREHLVRAALEAIAYQVRDVVDAMDVHLSLLRADGGAAANDFLMQFQADVAGVPVEVPAERETTVLGAAALAGLAVGTWAG